MRNFNNFFNTDKCKRILTIGIPDRAGTEEMGTARDPSTVVAIIGPVNSLKAQDIFLKAVLLMENADNIEFWVIGKIYDQEYYKKVKELADRTCSVKIWGELTREEIDRAFQKIDVLVCASQEETLSLTVVEAMMYGKVCITTDTTGVSEYIENGVNGFVIPSNDAAALRERMEWVLRNINTLDTVRMNARKTYEKYFNMQVFGRNLESALKGE